MTGTARGGAPNAFADGDAELIEASRMRPERFAEIFDRHFPEIHPYVDRRRGADAAADIAAEPFLVAFRKRDRFDSAKGSARPWLYGIATRLVSRHRRDELRRYRALARVGVGPDAESHEDRVAARVTASGAGARPSSAPAGP